MAYSIRAIQLQFVNLSIAFRNIVRQRRRSAIALGAIAFGISALILASGFIERLFHDFREDTIRSQVGHLQIVRPGYHASGKADPYKFMLPDTPPQLEEGDGPRRISTVAPRLSFSGLISRGEATLSFIGDGVSPREEAAFSNGLKISEGQDLSADEPRSAIVGEGLARNLGVKVGDQVVLLASTASGGTNAVEVKVRGLFSTVSKAYDDAALRVPIGTARELLRTTGSHVWVVLLNRTSDTDAVLRDLQQRFAADQFQVVHWKALSDFYNKTEVLFSRQLNGVRLIVAVIILLSILNTMMMSVMQRIGEIGTSMALGVKRTSIVQLFLSEGLLLGCLGAILGVLAGTGLAYVISAIGIPMPPPPGRTHGYLGGITVTWNIAIQSLAIAVVTTVLASIYPAWRASRMEIVDALRRNR